MPCLEQGGYLIAKTSTYSFDFTAEKSIVVCHIDRYQSLSGWTGKGGGVCGFFGQHLIGSSD